MESVTELIAAARAAAGNSYSPYSNFRVGCALRCRNGEIITGANVENRSYGLTICAERSAIVAAISKGHLEFVEIAIVGLDANYPLPPCGACRQVISEFLPDTATVYFSGADERIVNRTVGELLPDDSLRELR